MLSISLGLGVLSKVKVIQNIKREGRFFETQCSWNWIRIGFSQITVKSCVQLLSCINSVADSQTYARL